MKRFLQHSVLFLFVAALFYLGYLFIWGLFVPYKLSTNLKYIPGSYGHLHTRIEEVKDVKDIDILFLGSSHTYRGFDTRIFKQAGYKTFNLGSSAQTPIQTKVLLSRYFQNLKPKMVIYEVYPETFMIDGVESSLDLIANDRNDIHSISMALQLNNIKTYNTLIYGFMRDILHLNQTYSEPLNRGKDHYITGGFVERDMAYYTPGDIEKKDIRINPGQFSTFRQIIAFLKSQNVRIILVNAPVSSAKYRSYSNIAYFDSLMRSSAEYVNFNSTTKLKDTIDFYDADHLNQSGVEKFNRELIERLLNGPSQGN